MERYYRAELRITDALKDSKHGWVWNESYVLADDLVFCETELTPRKILRKLREWEYLTQSSKGRVRVEDYGELVEIQEKSTGRPIFAVLLYE